METRGPQINHLIFSDDVIIFTSETTTSLHLIMKTLSTYEAVSDKLINKEKSYFMIPPKTPTDITDMINIVTSFTQRDSPIN